VRSKYIVSENILRNIKYCARDKNFKVFTVESTKEIIEYLLNYKRNCIKKIEQDFGINILMSIKPEKVNNNYSIEKRENLTSLEKLDLLPVQNVGVVNELFEDSDFYENYENEMNDVKFSDECYYNRGEGVKPNNQERAAVVNRKPQQYSGNSAGNNVRKQQNSPNNRRKKIVNSRGDIGKKKDKTSILGKILGLFK
jgi:hypothetical protein